MKYTLVNCYITKLNLFSFRGRSTKTLGLVYLLETAATESDLLALGKLHLHCHPDFYKEIYAHPGNLNTVAVGKHFYTENLLFVVSGRNISLNLNSIFSFLNSYL